MVKASARTSPLGGLGLFADEHIAIGSIIWRYDPRFDVSFTPEEVEAFDPLQRDFIKRYAYLSKAQGVYILSIDDSRYTNHSAIRPNQDTFVFPGDIEDSGVANRDIEPGEEILANFREFDAHDETSNELYLRY